MFCERLNLANWWPLWFILISPHMVVATEPPTLKDAFAKRFLVGAAIGTEQISENEREALDLVAGQFNSITPENLLKWQEVHPATDQYNFEAADRFVEFGQRNRMFVVGHTLVWHNQTPNWVFENDGGTPLTRDELLKRLHDHIVSVVGRYKGRINGWDVVNEGIDDDGSMRKTKWQQIIGDDYLKARFPVCATKPIQKLSCTTTTTTNGNRRSGRPLRNSFSN